MKFYKRLRNSLKRPPSTRTWIGLITLVMALLLYADVTLMERQTIALYQNLQAQQVQAAQNELNAAINKTIRTLEEQTQRLIQWQELRAQFYDASHYYYWRAQSFPSSSFYSPTILELELYELEGQRLAGHVDKLKILDTRIPSFTLQWHSDGTHLYLLHYVPVLDGLGAPLGYAGLAFDFLDALRRHNTFQHIKLDQIRIQATGRYPIAQWRNLIQIAPRSDSIAQALMKQFQQVFNLLLLVFVAMILFLWSAQYFLQMRGYRQIMTTLKRIHNTQQPLPFPRSPLPIRELNQMLRLLIHLQRHWLRLRHRSERLLENIKRIAFIDSLTNLPNRNALIHDLEHSQLPEPFSLVLIDVANFRAFNDTYGSDTGDALLKKIAATLKQNLSEKPAAKIYRIGSDEFVVIIPKIDQTQALEFVEALIKQIESLTLESLTGHLSHIKIHAGMVHSDSLALHNLQKDNKTKCGFSAYMFCADSAMLAAKKQHLPVVDFDSLDNTNAPLLDHALGRVIDHAVLHGEGLMLYAQPIVSPHTSEVLYHELLVRVLDPNGRLISPAQLFEWIDYHHLHRHLDRQVIARAAEFLASGKLPAGQGISINLCEQTLLAEENMLKLLSPLQPFLPKHPVTIEVLESVLMLKLDAVQDQLTSLANQGFQVALDDFGSGYSSFRYLAQLPVNTVKIDRSLLKLLFSPLERERELFEQLCNLLSEAEFKVVVEGVETSEQCEHLRRLNITGMQGYLFSWPVPHPVTHIAYSICPPSSP